MHHMNITLIQLAKPTFCSHRSLLDIVRSLSTNLYYFHLPDHREIFIISTYISSDFFPYLLVLRHRGIRMPRCGYFLVVNFTAVLYLTFVWCGSSQARWGKNPSKALAQQLALTSVEKGLSSAYYINCLEQWGTITAGGTAAASYLVVFGLDRCGPANRFWSDLYSLYLTLYSYKKRKMTSN